MHTSIKSFSSCLISNPCPVQCRCTDPVNYRLVALVETDRDGSESSQVATTEAEHHDCGWRVDAGPLPPAAVAESRDDVFIFLQGLANCAVQRFMLRVLSAVCILQHVLGRGVDVKIMSSCVCMRINASVCV